MGCCVGLSHGFDTYDDDRGPDKEEARLSGNYAETLYPRTSVGWSELRAMRTDTWKLIVAPHPELYDLRHDPGERQNAIGQHAAEADQFQKLIWKVAGRQGKTEKVTAVPVDGKTRRELESLGYVSGGSAGTIQLGGEVPEREEHGSR